MNVWTVSESKLGKATDGLTGCAISLSQLVTLITCEEQVSIGRAKNIPSLGSSLPYEPDLVIPLNQSLDLAILHSKTSVLKTNDTSVSVYELISNSSDKFYKHS